MSTNRRHGIDVHDGRLIEDVRAGSTTAYDALYTRHINVARIVARKATRCAADADDIVSEAFTKILGLMQRQAGPVDEFRPYLCRVIKNLAKDGFRREQRVETSDELDPVDEDVRVDAVVDDVEKHAATRALASLPVSWREILWEMEVLMMQPRELADRHDSTPHNVSALAHRAREALRSAFLSEMLGSPPERCAPIANRLGAYVRGSTRSRETTKIEDHLDQCARCRGSLDSIRDLNSSFRLRPVLKDMPLAS